MPAQKQVYESWLAGFLAKGGKITHRYDYPFSRWKFFLAIEHFRLPNNPGFCGSAAFQVIIPAEIEFIGGDPGHCSLFFMKEFRVQDYTMVPAFSDLFMENEALAKLVRAVLL